ncbi:TonB-dependent receptor plug domain-containing protein, partial [Chitinimonas sp.]|uniref:TonB-dependent receptor plug domain-containing protein n=1 Tax=Chitinimonas sp. TaxID=1934313 RepID=UPI0035AF25B5
MKLTKIALAVALLGTAAHVAAADEQKVQKIEVTGSNIKRTATETASPIQVIRAEEIRKSGVTTVAELLKLVPALSSGGLDNLGGGSGFSSGASSASLRGLGSSSTLVLLNGRRMSPAAYADPNSGQSTIYNLNNIPLSAIERVEVVKDGASAVYGSDAIAGVVNFILRNDFEGAQLTVNGGKSLNGGFGNYSANGVIGKGDINKDRYNVMLAADVKHRDSARLDEADAIARDAYLRINNRLNPTFNATGTPASYYKERTPGSGAFTVLVGADSRCPASKLNAAGNCTWDQWAPLVAVAKSDEASLFSHGSLNINDNLSAFAEASFTESKATYPLNPVGVTQNPTTWFSTDGVRQSFLIVLAANHPDNPLFKANPNNT